MSKSLNFLGEYNFTPHPPQGNQKSGQRIQNLKGKGGIKREKKKNGKKKGEKGKMKEKKRKRKRKLVKKQVKKFRLRHTLKFDMRKRIQLKKIWGREEIKL